MASQLGFDQLREKYKNVILSNYTTEGSAAFKSALDAIQGREAERKLALDQAFRDAARTMLIEGQTASNLTAVVTCAVCCARQEMCNQVLPFTLLSDMLDCVTLDQCTDIFHYTDSHVDWWLEPRFYTSAGKNLLLRVCNNLLRRMSKPQNTVFCGRIQLFLAHLFPIYEKSALNLTSQFNQDNVTEFKTAEEITAASQNAMDTDEPNQSKVDYDVYQQLWSLQAFFSKPTDCYVSDKWTKFKAAVDHILNVFTTHPLESHNGASSQSSVSKGSASGKSSPAQTDALVTAAEPCSISLDGSEQQFYFPKYLTSEKLMDLELNDGNFRRQVLVQMLIVFQYLVGSVKFKTSSQTITDAQDTWVKSTKERVYDILKKMPPNGEKFASYIEQLLQREENWIDWKNSSCPRFTKPKEDSRNIQAPSREKKRSAARPLYTASKRIRWDMGSSELTRVWNINPDNVHSCSDKERQFTPILGDFFDEAMEQADPEAMVEEQYKVIYDSSFQFRALRLLSRNSPYFFAPPPTSKASAKGAVGPESIVAFLDQAIMQISKDINTDTPSTPQAQRQQSQPSSSQPSPAQPSPAQPTPPTAQSSGTEEAAASQKQQQLSVKEEAMDASSSSSPAAPAAAAAAGADATSPAAAEDNARTPVKVATPTPVST
eukprot:scpid39469/ scgid10154/ THO complex subunit 1; Nuclear matrix protein p84